MNKLIAFLLLISSCYVFAKETNTNLPPTNLVLSKNTIEENKGVGTLIGELSADDTDSSSLVYYLAEDYSDTFQDNDKFYIEGNKLYSKSVFDFETKSTFNLKIGVRNLLSDKIEKDFQIKVIDVVNEGFEIIEITDTDLKGINYHQTSFEKPTKLIFTNLTQIVRDPDQYEAEIYFHETVNLVAVEFPKLEKIDGYLYFHGNKSLTHVDLPVLTETGGSVYVYGNESLEKFNTPSLNRIYESLNVYGNKSLKELNICGLKEILKPTIYDYYYQDPYYSISGNTAQVDAAPFCFQTIAPTNLVLSKNTIEENKGVGTLIGELSAEGPDPTSLIYYLAEDYSDSFQDKDKFYIEGNKLYSKSVFDFETKSIYNIKIGVRNLLSDKIEKDFQIKVTDVVNEGFEVIEITDAILEDIYYHQTSFDKPTKLVFTNLTRLESNENYYTKRIYFNETVNLVAVEFPKLESVYGEIYFYGNKSLTHVDLPVLKETEDKVYISDNGLLETFNAPSLNRIYEYLNVYGNNSLKELNICGLKEILKPTIYDYYYQDPYYSISGNTAQVDAAPFCFQTIAPTNLVLSKNTIEENKGVGTLIGELSAEGPDPTSLIYYLAEDYSDSFQDKDKFYIEGNKLYSKSVFDFETKSTFNLKIGVRNLLSDKIEQSFQIKVTDVVNEEIEVIEITDTDFKGINYHQTSFNKPTKLVFTNLTQINIDPEQYQAEIYFHEVVNLVAVEFPKLEKIDGYLYFHGNKSLIHVDLPVLTETGGYVYVYGNESLEKFNTPSLNRIYESLNVYGNNSLKELNICGLKEILKPTIYDYYYQDPYYSISGNDNLNLVTTCLTKTKVEYVPEEDINVLPAPNTLVGKFITDITNGDEIRFFFIDEEGNETINPDFIIKDNGIYLAKDYSEYIDKNFNVRISAIRANSSNVSAKGAYRKTANGLSEKIDLVINIDISSSVLGTESFKYDQVNLYPNPNIGEFKLDLGNLIEGQITITDQLGKVIKQQFIKDKSVVDIDIADQAAGLYIVQVVIDNNVITKKVIKK